jgi:hypothetical protein
MIYWVLACIMYNDLRWIKYKSIGTDEMTRSIYSQYETFNAVRKLDIQFSFVVVVTGLVFLSDTSSEVAAGLAPNLLLLPIEYAWHWAGTRAMKTASWRFFWLFVFLSAFMPAFVIGVGTVAASGGPLFAEARKSNALVEIGSLVSVAVINRAVTVAAALRLACKFNTPAYAKLQELFRLGKSKFVRVGIRPPPIPFCGVDHGVCTRTCGARLADCCCERPNNAYFREVELETVVPGPPPPGQGGIAPSTEKMLGLAPEPAGKADATESLAPAGRRGRQSFLSAFEAAVASKPRDEADGSMSGAQSGVSSSARSLRASDDPVASPTSGSGLSSTALFSRDAESVRGPASVTTETSVSASQLREQKRQERLAKRREQLGQG